MNDERSEGLMILKRLTATDLSEVNPYIEGRAVPSRSGGRFATIDPSNGTRLQEIPVGCDDDVEQAVRSAGRAFKDGVWHAMSPGSKHDVLCKWAALIEASASRLDALDALEMGKPIRVAAFNASRAAGFVRFNAEAVDKLSGTTLPSDRQSTVIQTRVPRGVVGAIVPWNFPTYNCALKLAPALAAGNSVVLKPSELATQSGLLLAKLALEAGLPPGVLNVVPGCGETVGRSLAEHPCVDMITFTGSSAVGQLILQSSGRSNMKVVGAECGGKSPHIVFDDGLDLDGVAEHLAGMIVLNQGQMCSVGSRVLVEQRAHERLVARLAVRLEEIAVGDPQDPATTYGPLASKNQRDKVLNYVSEAVEAGAILAYGGKPLLQDSGGFFVQPGILVNVRSGHRIAQEEVFGPILSVLPFRDLDHALELANSTSYGLAAYVWTTRASVGFTVARSLQTAVTMVNSTLQGSEGPGYGFSGEPAGLSGVGIEGGLAGLESYLRRQTVWFNHG